MKLKIKEALFETNDVKQQVREFVEDRITDTLDNLSQVVASKIPGYNADWCDSDGRSAVANKLVQNIDSLVDAIVAVLFSEIGELNEATERENKDKPLTESEVREYTDKILDLIDDGILSAETVALCALKYMSEDDVKDMAIYNDLIYDEDLDESLSTKTNEAFRDDKLKNNFNESTVLNEDWSKGLLIKVNTTPESVKAACEQGKIEVPAVDEKGFENCYGETSLIVRFPDTNYKIFDYLNIYEEVCEFNYNLYDNEIKYEVDGGLSTINRIVKAQQIDDSVRSIIDMCVKKLTDAGIEVKDTNVRIVGTKGEYKFTESLSESIDIAADKIIRRVTNYLENHPYDDNMDVEDICREVASNLLDADYDNMDGETSHSIFTAVSNYLDDKHNLSESIEDTKTIKDALNKTITGVNDNGLGSTGAFASWIAYGFDLDTMNIVDIAVAMDFDVYKTNMGYFGTPDYLIMFPGKPITSYPDFNEDFIEDDFKKIN